MRLALSPSSAESKPCRGAVHYTFFESLLGRRRSVTAAIVHAIVLSTCSAYSSRALDVIRWVIYLLTDKRSLIVTPRIIICCTHSMSRHIGRNCCVLLARTLEYCYVISLHLLQAFKRNLFCFAHSCTRCISSTWVWLSAEMTKYE